MNVKLIVGLSNPIDKYLRSRHNVGAKLVLNLAKHFNNSMKKEDKFFSYKGEFILNRKKVYLLVPNIFMNCNGKAVAAFMKFYSIKTNDLLVVHDELDFFPGISRLKFGGSHGGHLGLKSVISYLKNSSDFYRLRIGIGHPGKKSSVANFVLEQPSIEEETLIDSSISESIQCIKIFIDQNFEIAVNWLHSSKD